MRFDINGNMIGAGEDAVHTLLTKWYGVTDDIKRTVPFKNFRVEVPWGLSDRQQKETIDIVLKYHPWTFCIRLQDGRHKGQGMARIDSIQKAFLEAIPYHKVVDIHQDDAPNLFEEKTDDKAEMELWLNFLENGVLICPNCHVIGRSDVIDQKVFCDHCGEEISIKVEFVP